MAGTDIEQFTAFRGGEEGVVYEQEIEQCIAQLESLRVPTVAVIEGWVMGGGLVIATACDFHIATLSSCFRVPIAKTVGNCMSVSNLARLTAVFGVPRVKRMLMLAENLMADEALACGFLLQVCKATEIDVALARLCERLCGFAPVTQAVTKEGLRRLKNQNLPSDEDLIHRCFGSEDFREGVEAFVSKRRPVWTGK